MTAPEPGTDIAEDLHRRRAASRRLPELDDGRRDPLDPPPRTPKVVRVRALGANTVEFLGADRAVYGAATRVGARFMRSPRRDAWQVHEADAEEVLAYLEHRGYRMDVTL